jgi:3-keto-5-aminohexanoate cleavage enzyme
MEPLIINLAGTGAVPTRRESPRVPLTPDEISEDCAQCCRRGATIVHLHARESDGTPSCRVEIYREIVRKVRAAAPDAIVCVSTSGRHAVAERPARPLRDARHTRCARKI